MKLNFGLILTLLVFAFSCSDNDDYVNIDKRTLDFEASGGCDTIILGTNASWIITNVPDWCSVSPDLGTSSTEIIVEVSPNTGSEIRTGTFEIICSGAIIHPVKITQKGNPEKQLNWKTLDVCKNFFPSVLREESTNRLNFHVQASKLFVNPNINKSVWLGNLVNSNIKNTNLSEYKGYTYNPITVSAKFVSKDMHPAQATFGTPSEEALKNFVTEVITKLGNNQEIFNYNFGSVEFNSYKELNLIGRGNLGLELDKLITEQSYQDQEMTKKNGLLYSFSQVLFDIDMDNPATLIKEAVKPEDSKDGGFSFISTISYGRLGFLVIESDEDAAKLKSAVDNSLANHSLTEEEKDVLNEISAYHIYFSENNTLEIKKGKGEEIIKEYFEGATVHGRNIHPVAFGIKNHKNNAARLMNYTIDLP